MLGSALQLGCTFTKKASPGLSSRTLNLPHGTVPPLLLSMTPQSWSVYFSWSYTFTSGLFQPLTGPSLSCSLWCLHVLKTSATWEMPTHSQVSLPVPGQTMLLSGLQLLCSDLQEALPIRFHLSDARLFLITAISATSNGQHPIICPSKATFHFSVFFFFNIRWVTLLKSLRDFQNFALKLCKPALHCLLCSQHCLLSSYRTGL